MLGKLHIRPASSTDADAVSAVISQALKVTNAQDYSDTVINRLLEEFSPEAVGKMIKNRIVFVATRESKIVGTASLDETVVKSVFVDPKEQKQGIGEELLLAIETFAGEHGITWLTLNSSVTAKGFYEHLGYTSGDTHSYQGEETIPMRRQITSRGT